jgi:DNA repair protein RadC
MNFKDKEKFICSFLDSQNKVIATSVIFEGTVNSAPIFPREILKKAISYDAVSTILSHNHPGGSTTPSGEDIATTDKVIKALSCIDVKVIDHIVVAGDKYTSLAEKGLIRTYEEINNKVVEDKAKYRTKGTKKHRISKDIQL